MTNSEIKSWSKEKIKGKIWTILPAILVATILTSLTVGGKTTVTDEGIHTTAGYSIGWIFYFVNVGLAYFMVKFITDQKTEFKDIFHFGSEFVRCLVTGLLQAIFTFLWALLFIIPGIIKAFAYSLVPMLLADEKYKSLGAMDLLKKSEELMKGHKMDYFLLILSFIGWHILAIFTLGLLEIWIIPYQTTAQMKFLYNVKSAAEGTKEAGTTENTPAHFCSNCGNKVEEGIEFCPNCGGKI